MMTTVSIDPIPTAPSASTPVTDAPSGAFETGAARPSGCVFDEAAALPSGLSALVAANAALGETLQAMVAALDAGTADPAAVLPRQGEDGPETEGDPMAFEPAVKHEVRRSADARPARSGSAAREESPAELPAAPAALPTVTVVADATPTSPVAATSAADPVSAVAPVTAAGLSEAFVAAAEAVASAVTVSPELRRGEAGEIRVQLRPDVLSGSEVVVSVDGRKMEVTFVPSVTAVADAVLANRGSLEAQLTARIPQFELSVSVLASVAANAASADGRPVKAVSGRDRRNDERA